MKTSLIIASMLLGLISGAQAQNAEIKTDAQGLVTVTARGTDVRPLLHDLFTQAKKNYVLEPGVRMATYLSLAGIEFEEALQIICKNADLTYEIQNGIYYISKIPGMKEVQDPDPKPEPPKGKLPAEVLARKVTTRLAKADIVVVLTELGKQAGVKIELDKSAPRFKIDAFLVGTSLKYALDTLTKATGLKYELTDNQTILVAKQDLNKVAVVKSGS